MTCPFAASIAAVRAIAAGERDADKIAAATGAPAEQVRAALAEGERIAAWRQEQLAKGRANDGSRVTVGAREKGRR